MSMDEMNSFFHLITITKLLSATQGAASPGWLVCIMLLDHDISQAGRDSCHQAKRVKELMDSCLNVTQGKLSISVT